MLINLFKRKRQQIKFKDKDLIIQTRQKKISDIEQILGSDLSFAY